MPKPIAPIVEHIWRFIRGDLSPRGFESWICSAPGAEEVLGHDAHFAAISADYRSADEIGALQKQLRAVADSSPPFTCRCVQLADEAVLDMGVETNITLQTLESRKVRGHPRWWLRVDRCRVCDQWWLIGQEERRNDVICLQRLDDSQGAAILDHDEWPACFDTYEALLVRGAARAPR